MNEEILEFSEKIKNIISGDGMCYFYHVTEKGNGKDILNYGLLLSENRLFSTTLPIDEEFKKSPIEFLNNEIGGSKLRKQDEVIIIGCSIDETNNLIQENYYHNENWNQEEEDKYIIPKEYIIGYIDVSEKKFIDNEDYIYYEDYYNYYK